VHKIILSALALSASIIGQADADYVWQFAPREVTAMSLSDDGGYIPNPGVSHDEAFSWLPQLAIHVTDAAFARQSLSLSWSGCYEQGLCQTENGDFADLIAFDGIFGTSPDYLYDYGAIDLAWTADGRLTGSIESLGMLDDLNVAAPIRGGEWAGWFASDGSNCGMQLGVARCEMAGEWNFQGHTPSDPSADVPEPASIMALAFGMLGIGAGRRLTRTDR